MQKLVKPRAVNTTNIVVYETQVYDMFELVPYNRDTSHAIKIMRSVDKIGPYFDHYPIVTVRQPNGKLAVYDGQGRLEAAREKKMPVYFIVSDRLKWDHVADLNCTVTPWTTEDYLKNFAEQGYEDYIAVIRFREKYPFIPVSFVRDVGQLGDNRRAQEEWKNGEWCFENEDLLRTIGDRAKDFRPYFSAWKDALFLKTLRHLSLSADYDHEWMISRLESGKRIQKRTTIPEYLQELTDVYRWRARGDRATVTLEEVLDANTRPMVEGKRAAMERDRLFNDN